MRQTVDIERGTITLHSDPPPVPRKLACGWFPEPWHPSRWNWPRSSASLALAMRYAILTPQQRAVHDAYCASEDCPRDLYDVLPAATRAAVDEARRKRAWKTNEPVGEWVEPA